MKKTIGILFGLCMAIVMSLFAFASSLPIDIDSVKVDGDVLESDTYTQLERGEEFEVKVSVSASDSVQDAGIVENIEIEAFISGYEHSRSGRMSDSTRPFDLSAGESVTKKLSLTLPERADNDQYQLRVIVSNRDSGTVIQEYGIRIQPSDSEVVITDFELSPDYNVKAGRSMFGNVRVKNLGDSTESDVKVKVTMPELGVNSVPSANYIDSLEEGKSAVSEFVLQTSPCAEPGLYEVVVEVTYDQGDEKTVSKKTIAIKQGSCEDAVSETSQAADVVGKTIITYSTDAQMIVAGGNVAYPVTITNTGISTKAFMLSVDPANWASFKISPSNVISVKGGSTYTAYVRATVNDASPEGVNAFTVSVKDASGDTLQNFAMKANVVSASGTGDLTSVTNALTAGLVVVVGVLVAVGLLVAFRRVRNNDDGESQTYY